MAFNIGVTQKVEDFSDELDSNIIYGYENDSKEVAIEKLEQIINKLSRLPAVEQISVIEFLKEDPTIATIVGDNPSLYMTNLSNYNKQASQELLGVLAQYAHLAYSNRYKGVLSSLDKCRNKPIVNTFSNELTKDIRIVPVKQMFETIKGTKTLLEFLQYSLDHLDKFEPQQMAKHYRAIGLRIPDKHLGFFAFGTLYEVLMNVLAVLDGGAIGYGVYCIFFGMGMVPAAVLGILVGTIFEGGLSAVGNRFGTSLRNKSYTTAAARGWNMNNLKQATAEFYKLDALFEKVDFAYKEAKRDSINRDKIRHIKRGYQIAFYSIKGCAKSLKVLYNALTSETGY